MLFLHTALQPTYCCALHTETSAEEGIEADMLVPNDPPQHSKSYMHATLDSGHCTALRGNATSEFVTWQACIVKALPKARADLRASNHSIQSSFNRS